MSGQDITAEELEGLAERDEFVLVTVVRAAIRRAARTIRRLEGEVAEYAEMQEQWRALSRDPTAKLGSMVADAELGSLVRRIREHPEGGKGHLTVTWKSAPWRYAVTPETLANVLDELNATAHRRAAEEGERGLPAPSGRRYRMRDGELWVRPVDAAHWNLVTENAFLPYSDHDVVERVRKGVARDE